MDFKGKDKNYIDEWIRMMLPPPILICLHMKDWDI